MINILIYSDKDSKTNIDNLVPSLCESLPVKLKSLSFCNRETLVQSLGEKPDIFILPGIRGDQCDYYDALGGKRAEAILSYVENGGVYIGFCAGAYYTMSDIVYYTSSDTFKVRKSPFAFIEGKAIGPVSGANLSDEFSTAWEHHGVRPMTLAKDFRSSSTGMAALYANGPTFEGKGYTILTNYGDHKKSPPSLIAQKFGRGLVIASGTCPQFSYAHYEGLITSGLTSDTFNRLRNTYNDLEERDAERRNYMRFILETALQHSAKLEKQGVSMVSVPS